MSAPPDQPPLRQALVVDPDARARALYRDVLRGLGWDAVEVADGRDALTYALVHRPALLITEARLPRISGVPLCEILKHDVLTADMPIIVVTTDARSTTRRQFRRLGVEALLVKPTSAERLVTQIHAVWDRSEAPEDGLRVPDDDRRRMRSRIYRRYTTVTPPTPPPTLPCPSCTQPLVYVDTHLGGVTEQSSERWDTYTCATCGRFEYRHRTHKLRRLD